MATASLTSILNPNLSSTKSTGRLATLAAVRPAKRFGVLDLEGNRVTRFAEKPEDEGGWINGGFLFLSPKVGQFIEGDTTIWEQGPLKRLLSPKISCVRSATMGFGTRWTRYAIKIIFENLWASGQAKWCLWS